MTSSIEFITAKIESINAKIESLTSDKNNIKLNIIFKSIINLYRCDELNNAYNRVHFPTQEQIDKINQKYDDEINKL